MLNLTVRNDLIELNCRTWWPDKANAEVIEKTVNGEEFLPHNQSMQGSEAIVPPESIFFAIECA